MTKTKSSLDLLRDMTQELNDREVAQEEYVLKLEKVLRRCIGEQCETVIRIMEEERVVITERDEIE